ncbi:MAG: hypothetical protein ACLTYW_00850 [Collinsella sp.]
MMPSERHAERVFPGRLAVTAARIYKDAAEQELMCPAANDAVMADAIKLVHEGNEREIADQMLGLYRSTAARALVGRS